MLNSDPLPEAEEMDCFVNVEQAIAKNGGRAVYGWAIWQVPGVYIEAEFHCVWENDAGEMLDVTPYPYVWITFSFSLIAQGLTRAGR